MRLRDRITLHLKQSLRAFHQDERGIALDFDDGTNAGGSVAHRADGFGPWSDSAFIPDGVAQPRACGVPGRLAGLRGARDLLSDDVQVWSARDINLVCYSYARQPFNVVAIFQSGRYTEGWTARPTRTALEERVQDACPAIKRLLAVHRALARVGAVRS